MAPRPNWLNADEQATWRSYLLTTQLVDESLDRQLQRDAGIPHAYYGILVSLSESDDARMRMSDLASRLRYSQSRMTHAVNSLEAKGWVRRERSDVDRRGQWAVLTPTGRAALSAAAPGHVAEVRRVVIDRLSTEQVTQLRDICDTILDGFDQTG
ncbi:MAG: MarR family transcriptional regulator [Acidimicrobiales bacterium]